MAAGNSPNFATKNDARTFLARLDRLCLIRRIINVISEKHHVERIKLEGVPEDVADSELLHENIPNPTLDGLMAAARGTMPKFQALLEYIDRTIPGTNLITSHMKAEARVLAKAEKYAERSPDGTLASGLLRVTDVVRGSIICHSAAQVNKVFEALKAAPGVTVVRCKNRFSHPSTTGFRDALVNVRVGGMVCEIQIHLANIYTADRILDSHSEYEYLRQHFDGDDERMRRWVQRVDVVRGDKSAEVQPIPGRPDLDLLRRLYKAFDEAIANHQPSQ